MMAGLIQGLIVTAGIVWALFTAALAAAAFTPDEDSKLAELLARLPHPLGHLAGIVLAALWPVWLALILVALLMATVVGLVASLVLDVFYRRRAP
jgi:hypothetical protein